MTIPGNPPAPPRPERHRLRHVLLGTVILVCGFLIGVGVSGHLLWYRLLHGGPTPERLSRRITERLTDRLDLSEEQEAQVRRILAGHRRRLSEIIEDTHPRMDQEIERLQAEVAAVLTPEQAERWREQIRRMRERWQRWRPGEEGPGPRPPGPPPPGHPRGDGPPPSGS